MDSLYLWLKFIHVLAGFTFFLSHGTSIAVAFKLKREKQLSRIHALFDLSGSMWNITMISLLVLLVVGIVISFMGNWWKFGWIWVSLVLLVGITVWMFVLGQGTYHPIRKAIGLPYMHKSKELPAEDPIPESEWLEMIAHTRPWEMLIIAYGGFVVIIWLMMFKPF